MCQSEELSNRYRSRRQRWDLELCRSIRHISSQLLSFILIETVSGLSRCSSLAAVGVEELESLLLESIKVSLYPAREWMVWHSAAFSFWNRRWGMRAYLLAKLKRKARMVFSIDLALTFIRGVMVEPTNWNGLKVKMAFRILLEMDALVRARTPILFTVAVTIRASLFVWLG